VLHGISGENVQSVFDIIQPMLTGNYDIRREEKDLENEKSEKIISYIQSSFASYTHKKAESGEDSSGKSLAAIFGEKDFVTDSSNAINGYFVRFEKGNLGLQRGKNE
jgi:hypothetical protein